ncbi:MAG: thioredoxin domain-containing protein, partial [Bacteroidia bacterium]|nr:thioredoxin domain-containing protein [Bacteroidia bacterium]
MNTDTKHKYSNALVNETSPYLLQHAHNPVNWYPWGDEALQKAKDENKLLLISVGYSACHWCHVMERESFEDSLVASIMNDNFINIKVDREERPDIDQIYMTAVQLMTGSGGWPLNCIALPDGRPVFGGTYFPKEKWTEALENISQIYDEDPEKVMEYATKLTGGVKQAELIPLNTSNDAFDIADLDNMYDNWSKKFDYNNGGPNRAPKFPIPNNYQYLLRYNYFKQDTKLTEYLETTLDKIAMGGIYDHLGGGFARYSTDIIWKVPHFEKMLYDNAQLVSLYSEAYQVYPKQMYKDAVYETCAFVKREMMDKTGAFYSAYDADSEGVEGKFYVWKEEELKNLLGEGFDLFAEYYNVNSYGFWEH